MATGITTVARESWHGQTRLARLARMAFRQCWLAVVLSAPCLVYPATVLEDFESAAADQRWTFSNGQEFPGAKGSFARTREAAHGSDYGGELAFDFEGGGQLNELGVVQG